MSKQNVFIRTFGCQMNEYDSLKLAKILGDGYQRVETPEQADLVLINTCSVREKPEQKLFNTLGEMAEIRRQNPKLLVGVGGCVAQQEGAAIVKRSKQVDFVFGTHNLSLVPSLIERRLESGKPQVAVNYRDEWEELPLGLPEPQPGQPQRVVAFLAISRGCNKNCTYCIVPTTRGPEVSRSADEIEREVRLLVRSGVREVVLLGQTVNSYGKDLTPRQSFAGLLERISAIDGLYRIRFTSPHPQEIREDFIELVARNPKVCRHVHMPLQSGSDRILKAMNRNYRQRRYLEIIEALRERVPDIAITTDVIVGFPGETDADFEATMEVLEKVQFASSFSFIFSPRPGTAAENLPDQVPYAVRSERLQRFLARQEEISQAILQRCVGSTFEVLLDSVSPAAPDTLRGRNSQNFVVHLDKPESGLKPGMLVPVRVTESKRHTLQGEVVSQTKLQADSAKQLAASGLPLSAVG